ncbi:MAG: hypothetical protein ACYCXF_06030 [Thermoleophilia bacterium]
MRQTVHGRQQELIERLGVSHGEVVMDTLPDGFVETSAIYVADNPNCCPSNILKTAYTWAASAGVFTKVSVEMAPNPQASTAAKL